MKKVIRLTESDLTRIVRRVINEQNEPSFIQSIKNLYRDVVDGGDIDYDYIENSATAKELADLIYESLKDWDSSNLYRGKNPEANRDNLQNAQNPLPKDYSALEIDTEGDTEAVVEAAFLNMSKPLKTEGNCPECWKKYTEVSKLYKQRFNRYMIKDVKDNIDIYRKYHKKSINSIINSWGR
jgi:hypothetical protein